jgi:hypothetical protein
MTTWDHPRLVPYDYGFMTMAAKAVAESTASSGVATSL